MEKLEAFKEMLQKKQETEKILGIVDVAYWFLIRDIKDGEDIGDYVIAHNKYLREGMQHLIDQFLDGYVSAEEEEHQERFREILVKYIFNFIGIDISYQVGVESLMYYLSMYHIDKKGMTASDYMVNTLRIKYNSRHELENYKLSRRLKFNLSI